MWISVHEIMFELETKVTHIIFKNWICSSVNEENFSIFNHILEQVEYKPNYYNQLVTTVESEFISDTALLMPKVK
jgi:hypothetical protein